MAAIALLVALAAALSLRPVRRALPMDSLVAAVAAGCVMAGLLAAGHAG